MIRTVEELEAIYGQASPNSLIKVADRLTPEYRAWIEASPFCALATSGPEGLDCSPRGDDGPVVTILDEHKLAMPDWRGNNRIDSLRNIVRDPRVSLMFLIPGAEIVIRVNGTGRLVADEDTLQRFESHGSLPRTVLLVDIAEVYFQCSKAVHRAGLWTGEHADPATLPSAGRILKAMSRDGFDAEGYDRDAPDRAAKTLW